MLNQNLPNIENGVFLRRSALSIMSIAVMLFILASYTVPVHAQTTSISNLTYPTVALAGGQADVSFTVTYSTSETYALLIAVSNEVNNYSTVSGEVVKSSPSACMSGAELGIVSSILASCFDTVSGSGSEYVEFSLTLTPIPTIMTLSPLLVCGHIGTCG